MVLVRMMRTAHASGRRALPAACLVARRGLLTVKDVKACYVVLPVHEV